MHTYEKLRRSTWQQVAVGLNVVAEVCPVCGAHVATGYDLLRRMSHRDIHLRWHAELDSHLYLYNVPTPKGE